MSNTLRARLAPSDEKRGRRRGLRGQRERRAAEAAHRLAVGEVVLAALEGAKTSVCELANAIGMSARTIYDWARRARKARETGVAILPRGRRPTQSEVADRNAVVAFLREHGPNVGVPILQATFRGMPRREVEELQRRHREWHLERHRVYVESLTWNVPGSVWAMDFTQVESQPLDGEFPYVFVVRDLASGNVIMALPIRDEGAITCIGALTALFDLYGPPLVLKADNGAAFIAEETRYLAAQWGVALLYSPPQTPSFNGSCEAGMGGLKTRTHYIAARHGRPGAWTCDDLEAGRLQCNLLGRPSGPLGATPDQVWRSRASLPAGLRRAFRATLSMHQASQRARLGHAPEAQLTRAEQAQVDRHATRRALVEHGLLCVERRWIPLRNRR